MSELDQNSNLSADQPVSATPPAPSDVTPPVSATPPQPKKVSSAADFKKAREEREAGELVELDGGFTARLKRPSLNNLVKTGQLPLELANAAIKVESGGNVKDADVQKFTEYQERIARLSLMEPRVAAQGSEPNYDDNEIALDDLSDAQLTEIVIYVNGGLEALAQFRQRG
jgi:hypothetical protein